MSFVQQINQFSKNVHYWIKHPNRPFNLLGIPVIRNDFQILAFKNHYQGGRCFIIGNGPSLLISDLERLKRETTFACNKIYLAFDQIDWRPTYYSIQDVLVAEQNSSEIDDLDLQKFYGHEVKPYLKDKKNVTWLVTKSFPLCKGKPTPKFSTNLLRGAYGGGTIIYHQLQIAYYMGIREVYLIGVDFSFDIPEPTGEMCLHGEVIEHQGEINHFDPNYRKIGERWTMPQLGLQYKSFSYAKEFFERHRGRIFNASRKTALDVFPLIDFDTIIPF